MPPSLLGRSGWTGFVPALLIAWLAPTASGWAQAVRNDATPVRRGASHLVEAREARKRFGLSPDYEDFAGIEAVKVAILDYGFDGMADGGPYLPNSAEVVEHYDPDFIRRFGLGDPEYRKGFEPGNRHGRVMAQIVWAMTGSHRGGPKFYLLNANGPTMLRRGVRFAMEHKVDVILFSGSFEGGGNGDGRGPIDQIVSEAIDSGILWVNAAGNFGGHVYNGPVRILNDGFLRLRGGSDIAALRFRNYLDENAVTITLTWNDYREEEDAGTDKDLDVFVEDPAGRRVGSGEKEQTSRPGELGPEETRNPRERVVLTNLPASPRVRTDPDYAYRIRVRAKRGRFTADDRIRVLVSASRESFLPPGSTTPTAAIEFLDASGEGEIYPPADHPLVLTVGDADPSSSVGPTLDRRPKPDAVIQDSRAYFSDGEVSGGSSDAAAYVAGVVAVLKAASPGLTPRDLIRIARLGPAVPLSPERSRPPRRVDSLAGLHLWKTPDRARLAQILFDARR